MNLFVKKQIYSYAMDKSGVRDNLQNANALVLFEPQLALANILKCLAVQKADGSSLHSWRPLNRHQYSDKPAWMLQTIPWYVQETGDFTILDERVPFFESAENGTVWDHLQRAYRWLSADLGKRGLCRQHYADWNDGLEPSEKTGERESVMVSQQLCAGLLETAALAERCGDAARAAECLRLHREMAEKINRAAWDGAWFSRTICEDGYALGSGRNAEAKIFINTQSWAVIGRIAEESRLRQCMAAVDQYLTKPEGYPICDPPCSTFDERIGRFTTVMPRNNENGGCYNHAAGFKCVADCLLGRAEEAWQTFTKVAPDGPNLPIGISGAETFSFINHYSRVPSGFGKGGYPWRTGTAAWFTVALLEYILGARRGYDGLIIAPCLSKTVSHAKLRRKFRGATYDIALDNTAGRCVGARRIVVDGKLIAGNTLPLFGGGTHTVEVEI
jgi:cellobiose phosphorylase